ncbi:MAG TPA: AsmA-like C-terminal region-containing protein, partial [Balneolaceae bacterium]|nr:AsmA-like C-terminal region-containing protein [Balneolaceae bacterium]
FFKTYPILGNDSQFYKFISGTFSSQVDYTTKIDTALNPLISTTLLSGTFGMSDAVVNNHPLQKKLAGFLNLKEFNRVVLDQWESTVLVKDNILHLKDLTLTSDDIGFELNGTQNLITDKIDFSVSVLLPARFKKAIASVITARAASALSRDDGTIRVPLRITGTYGNPNIQPDKEVIEPIVKDFLKRKAGNVLKNLFGGDDKQQNKADTTAADSTS